MTDTTNTVIQAAMDTATKASEATSTTQKALVEGGIDWQYVSILAIIMLATGVIGGLANSLNTRKEERDYPRSVLLGVVATLTIPLFLNIVDSKIIAEDGILNNYSILVFAGFCVLAAFYANNFLEGLSSRVLQDLKKKVEKTDQKLSETDEKLRETAQKTDLVVDTQIAASQSADGKKGIARKSGDFSVLAGEGSSLAKLEAAFGTNLETLDTLIEKTGLSKEEVQKNLEELIKEGLVRQSTHRGQAVFGRV